MAGPTHSGRCFEIPYVPPPLRLPTRQALERLHGKPERIETYALADGGWIEVCFYRMPQPVRRWRRLFRVSERKSPPKQLVPWGFRDGRFAGQWQLYKRLTQSSTVTLVSTESAPAGRCSAGQ